MTIKGDERCMSMSERSQKATVNKTLMIYKKEMWGSHKNQISQKLKYPFLKSVLNVLCFEAQV